MKKLIIINILVLCFFTNLSWAQDDQFESYDDIVDQLSITKSSGKLNYNNDPFDAILLHAGVGMALSMTSFQFDNHSSTGLFQGVEVNLGIDLFSDNWMAEGSYVNLGRAEIENKESLDYAELNEFNMKLVYRPHINRFLRFRGTTGLAARYLKYYDNAANKVLNFNTPSWAFALGLEAKLTQAFSFTTEIAYRSSMITETIDDNAFGAGLRLDANF
ncbi:MAG: outer membrane beta-barrel protein [Bdellovibrionales bacterium]|nr:outer membrane beta-barrel protein [Bdellovibrionales bacterium]